MPVESRSVEPKEGAIFEVQSNRIDAALRTLVRCLAAAAARSTIAENHDDDPLPEP